jgi:aspartyl/asparaginyl beta-hydroxylase (cupin superfamily)
VKLAAGEAEALLRAGWAALQRGDPAEARTAFERLVEAGIANPQVLLLLALACRNGGDPEAEEQTLDRLLASEPGSLRGLIGKGDCRARAGDDRAATSFYKAAMATGAAARELPADVAADLERIRSFCDRTGQLFRDHLLDSLARSGFGDEQRSERFQQSLDIMFGEKRIFLQEPTGYYFPGLPQIQFYDRASFPWLAAVESATDGIRDEIEALLADSDAFRPYLVSGTDRPQFNVHGLLDNPDWSTLYLWENGGPVEANVERCPRTMAALSEVPLPHITTRAPAIFFSRLSPGARIPPHHGMLNARLICHLPLIVPEGCGLRVGNETRRWEVGKALIFDDTIEHEAWNEDEEDRIVLIFDIWRPELTEEERRSVTAVFEAVDSYGAEGPNPGAGFGPNA